MTSTGIVDVRDPEDHYVTPSWAVDAILPHLPLAGVVVDAGCGSGGILMRVAPRAPPRTVIVGVELNASRSAAAEARVAAFPAADGCHNVTICRQNFITADVPGCANLVISNPPFKLAMDFAVRSLELTKHTAGTVALLLRLDWLGTKQRAAFHRAHPCDIYVLPRRPAFCASVKCKDRVHCGWHDTFEIGAVRPPRCPVCGGAVTVVTSDSCEYGWAVWGPGRGGRWSILDVPEAK